MRPLAALAILAGTTPAWGQSAPGGDFGQVTAEVRARPDESRIEFEQQLSLATTASDDIRQAHLARAGALAQAYAAVWHDSVPLRTVVRFASWPVERRVERMLADSIRRQGNAALGSGGFPAALSLWRESLRHAAAAGDSGAIAAALVNIGSGYYRAGELDSAAAWLRQSHWRRAARQLDGEIRLLRQELAAIRNRSPAEPAPPATTYFDPNPRPAISPPAP